MANNQKPKLNIDRASELLEGVFEKCEVEPNTVPMKELASYSNFRVGTFYIQRILIAILFIVLLFLPARFFYPHVEIEKEEEGNRGFPVYSIDVKSPLKVKSVIATSAGKELPVYPCDSHLFTVEPTKDGTVYVEVTLVNGLTDKQYFTVGGINNTTVEYIGQREEDGIVYLYFNDIGLGINAKNSYLTTDNGTTRIKPIAYSEEENYLAFEKPDGAYEVVISNLVGNSRTYQFK